MTLKAISAIRDLCESNVVEMSHFVDVMWEFIGF